MFARLARIVLTNCELFVHKRSPLVLLMLMLSMVVGSAAVPSSVAQAAPSQSMRFSPSKISPNDGYYVYGLNSDGVNWSGPLDFELRKCDLKFQNCTVGSGPWGYSASNGTAYVPGGQNFPVGIYMTRFKRSGYSSAEYTNFAVLVIDSYATYYAPPGPSQGTIAAPARGGYTLFEKAGAPGQLTRIEYETDACSGNGTNMRITKTSAGTYWNPGGPKQFRWCLKDASTGVGTVYSPRIFETWTAPASLDQTANTGVNVFYDSGSTRTPGLLGVLSMGGSYSATPYDGFAQKEMAEHYNLLTVGRQVPSGLSNTPRALFEMTVGFDPTGYGPDGVINMWHTEVLAPTVAGAALRMRYFERGVSIGSTGVATQRWSVVEDWEWGYDGLIRKVVQWDNVPPLCWRPSSGYNPSSTLSQNCLTTQTAYLNPIEVYPANSSGLTLALNGITSGTATILNGQRYRLQVTKSDGTPYSGFIELLPSGGTGAIWRDKQNKPIYVYRGSVYVGPEAYGSLPNWSLTFAVRPFPTNSVLNAIAPVADSQLAGKERSLVGWSNQVTLRIQ